MNVMNASELVDEFLALGVSFWEDQGQLRFRAPKGVMTDERRALLKANKEALFDVIRMDADARRLSLFPTERFKPFPLTGVQEAYLLGRQDIYDYGGLACQIYVELKIEDAVPARLKTAFDKVVARHDMLRATVHSDGYQEVLVTAPVWKMRAHQYTDAGFNASVLKTRSAFERLTFDPAVWPLFDIELSSAPSQSILHFKIDCLIADFTSVQIILNDLSKSYEDENHCLPPLELTFRDCLLHERGKRDTMAFQRDKAYWMERIDSLPRAPDLPLLSDSLNAPRSFERHSFVLEPDEWSAFKEGAARCNVTATVALLGAYAAILNRWSVNSEFCLNLTMVSRNVAHPQVNEIVGDFTSVSLLEVNAAADVEGFATGLGRLQTQLWADMDHRQFTGIDVLRELARAHGQREALMPIVFTSTVGLEESATRLGQPVFGQSQTPQVWIDCQTIERDGGLVVQWDVRHGVFPNGVAAAMFNAMVDFIAKLSEPSYDWTARLQFEIPSDQKTARAKVNALSQPVRQERLYDGILAQARVDPDALAIIDAYGTATYAEVVQGASCIAAHLQGKGLAKGDIVAISLEKGRQQVMAVLGVLMAGGVYLPLDRALPPSRRATILADAKVDIVLTKEDGGWPAVITAMDPDLLSVDVDPLDIPLTDPADRAYVIYTSGSTGSPKGVVISHVAALNTIDCVNKMVKISATDRVFGLANLSFDLSVYDIFGPLSVGAAVVIPGEDERNEPGRWLDLISTHGVTLWNSVPAQLQMLSHAMGVKANDKVRSLRTLLLSGDWVPLHLVDWQKAALPEAQLFALGGATEASIWSNAHEVKKIDPSWSSVPYGLPLANQQYHVLTSDMQYCPDWVTGELWIGGLGLAVEYLGDPEKTAERFQVHPVTGERLYRTGDLGRYRDGAVLEFLGRQDTQIKLRGHRIELGDIDSALQSHPGVALSATLVDGADAMSRQITAFVEAKRTESAPSKWSYEPPANPNLDEAEAFAAALAKMNEVARLQFATILMAEGGFAPGACWGSFSQICERLSVASHQLRLFQQWLDILCASRILVEAEGFYAQIDTALENRLASERINLSKLARGSEFFRSAAEFLRKCGELTPPLLRGDIAARDVFVPQSDDALDVPDTSATVISKQLNAHIAAAIKSITSQDRPLSVLEIGCGEGNNFAALKDVEDLPEFDYTATDISPFFLNRIEARFTDGARPQTARLDIDLDMRKQGFRTNSYDVVVARNVLHNATNIHNSLAQVATLLCPGGLLLIEETVAESAWTMAGLEFLIGDIAFTDVREGTSAVFLAAETWRSLLEQVAGEMPISWPPAKDVLSGSGQMLFATRVKANCFSLDEADLRVYVGSKLPGYMVPRQIHVVDQLPLSANGKIDRKTLSTWQQNDAYSSRPLDGQEGPKDGLEQRLTDVWRDVLNLDVIARHDGFFEIGGDSLLISQVSSQLQADFPEAKNLLFSQIMRQILHQPTIAELADFLRNAEPQSDDVLAEAAPASPLTPMGKHVGGSKTIFVHDLGGTMSPYLSLSNALGEDLAHMGLAVTKVADYLARRSEDLFDTIISEYVDLLRTQDVGQIVGYGMGGLLAMNVAARLAEQRADAVSLTVIGGCGSPCSVSDDLALDFAFARFLGVDPAACGFERVEEHFDRILRDVGKTGLVPDGILAELVDDPEIGADVARLIGTPSEDRLLAIASGLEAQRDPSYALDFTKAHSSLFRHSLAGLVHVPLPVFSGDITLLLPQAPPPALPWLQADIEGFWRERCLGDVSTVSIPGNHFSCLQTPNVETVAQKLTQIERMRCV